MKNRMNLLCFLLLSLSLYSCGKKGAPETVASGPATSTVADSSKEKQASKDESNKTAGATTVDQKTVAGTDASDTSKKADAEAKLPTANETKKAPGKEEKTGNDAKIEKIDERTCIDDQLNIDLSSSSVKKMIVNTDITFCNGTHLRLKTYKLGPKKYKALGLVISNSGRESCLKESEEFSKVWPLGDRGVLVGDNIKITLGGHELDSNNKLVSSKHFFKRQVKFTEDKFSGEMAIFENGKLSCFEMQ
ncbi:MAG: hypothetical protein ACXVCE_01760 [Bacteriovorax sp.]